MTDTIESLIAEYTAWTLERKRPQLSADELSLEIQGDLPRHLLFGADLADVEWLDRFIARWDAAAEWYVG